MNNSNQGIGKIDFRRHKNLITVLAFVILFAGGIAGGYFFFLKTSPKAREAGRTEVVRPTGPVTEIQVYFPSEGRLKAESRSVTQALSKRAAARATVEEFLKGPSSGIKSFIPQNARVLGIYDGEDGILYIDLSDEFRRNLQVDAISEFLLMRGLYESVLTNVYGVADVKILIEGAEVETLGGHISLIKPLGDTVSQTLVEE
jgi:spore germination protein GerM